MIYKKRRNVGILLLLISIAFITYGAMRGEMETVLGKAINTNTYLNPYTISNPYK